MKIRITRNTANDLLVYCSLFLYITVSLLNTTFFVKYIPGFLYHIISLFSIFLLIIYNVLTKKTRFLGALLTFLLLASLVFLSFGYFSTYIYSLAIIFLVKDFGLKRLVKFILPVIISLFILILFSSRVGIIQDYVEVTSTRIRHYLGFRYALFPSTVMLNILGLYLYSKQEKITYWELFVLSISVTWIFVQTNSRVTFISSGFLLLLGLIYKIFPNFLYKIRFLLSLFIPVYIYSAILSYIVAMMFPRSDSFLRLINNFLGGRIYLANKSLSIYGFDWLGKNIQWVGNGLSSEGRRSSLSYLYVDNLYVQVLQSYGLLFLMFFTILLTISLFLLYKNKQYFLLTIMVILATHAMIDDLTFQLHYNFFLVLLGLPFAANLSNQFVLKSDEIR